MNLMRVGLTISTLLLAGVALHADTPRTPVAGLHMQSSMDMTKISATPPLSYMVEFSDTLQIEPPSDTRSTTKRSLPAQFVPGIQSAAHSAARFLTEKVLRLR